MKQYDKKVTFSHFLVLSAFMLMRQSYKIRQFNYVLGYNTALHLRYQFIAIMLRSYRRKQHSSQKVIKLWLCAVNTAITRHKMAIEPLQVTDENLARSSKWFDRVLEELNGKNGQG